eukprot:1192428-Pyramimonas_sp.AAC.1
MPQKTRSGASVDFSAEVDESRGFLCSTHSSQPSEVSIKEWFLGGEPHGFRFQGPFLSWPNVVTLKNGCP